MKQKYSANRNFSWVLKCLTVCSMSRKCDWNKLLQNR